MKVGAIGTETGNVNMTSLLISMFFGTVGCGFIMYGRKMAAIVPILAGLALMIVPYFIGNVIILSFACIIIMALPLVLRER